MKKSPEIQKFVDACAKEMFGWDGNPIHCRTCNNLAGEFRNVLSQKEYEISGMCQKCQDDFFGAD